MQGTKGIRLPRAALQATFPSIAMEGNTDLIQHIVRQITEEGPVSFSWFMQQALYHPHYGYYATGVSRIGREGDFFTNVSVGPLFGRLLAIQFQEMWEQLGRPVPFTIVEQGANTGDFAADVLKTLQGLQAGEGIGLFQVLEYRIVEPFPALRAQQAQKLQGLGPVHWHDSLDQLEPFCGVHFSNELLDSLPVHLLRCFEGSWRERYVGWENQEFVFVDRPISDPQVTALIPFAPTPATAPCGGAQIQHECHSQSHGQDESSPGGASFYQTEVNPAALGWLDQVAGKITRGFLLAIDYGYPREEFFHPDRSTGTLTCYSKHQQSSNPLERVGLTDITAHVEFSSLIQRGLAQGMSLCGFTDQHRYMVGLAAPMLAELNPKELRAFRTLMHPSFMGSAFKVLALQKGIAAKLRGFSGTQLHP